MLKEVAMSIADQTPAGGKREALFRS